MQGADEARTIHNGLHGDWVLSHRSRPPTSAAFGGPARATPWLAGLLAILILGSAATAAAELSYVGSSTIGDHIIPAAAEAFARKTGVKLRSIDTQGSGKGLELVVRGAAPLAGVSRSLTVVEKQQRIYYQTIGYDAVAVYVHGSNPVTSLSKAALKGIYTGRIRSWKEVGGKDAPLVVITQIWGAKRAQMVEFRDQVMDGAAYREDRREVDREPDQVAALLSEPHGITAVSLALARPGIRAVAIEGFPRTPEVCAPGPTSCRARCCWSPPRVRTPTPGASSSSC